MGLELELGLGLGLQAKSRRWSFTVDPQCEVRQWEEPVRQ